MAGSAAMNARNGWLIATAVLAIALAAIAMYWIWHSWRTPPAASLSGRIRLPPERQAIPQKSIAVLPFQNLSKDEENAYFAEGIQDEILTRLAKLADLKVISRTSTQHYKSAPENLPQIAQQLGVANILEGSVQKAGDSVRINVQLIKPANDSHLWADTYDRRLVDAFSVESEVVRAIADQLQVTLTGCEQEALSIKPTKNAEAYDAYLRGLAFNARGGDLELNSQKAISFYKRAVQLDPNFAAAWARFSRAESFLYFNGLVIVRDAAERALNAAQKLQPHAPESLLAKGFYQYCVSGDDHGAKAAFESARNALPGSSDALMALARIARRQGEWARCLAHWERASALDPRNSELLADWALTYSALRQFPIARKLYDRALDIEPNDGDLLAAKAWTYQAEGNLEEAAKWLVAVDGAKAPSTAADIKIGQLVLERRYDEAIQFLKVRMSGFLSEDEMELDRVWLAVIQRFAADITSAAATAREAQQTLKTLRKNEPNKLLWPLLLSRTHAVLDEKNAALEQAERAIMLLPSFKDALTGPVFEENAALIEAMVGDNARAIQRLQHLLQVPYGSDNSPITPALLRLDPAWDPLRADPAFKKLCEEKPR